MTILVTSFDTWLNHQRDNASDRLLEQVEEIIDSDDDWGDGHPVYFCRKLPVDIAQAGGLTIEAIEARQATTVICCGMAESRSILTLESNARRRNHKLLTTVDLNPLLPLLSFTGLSHDAGRFVCEGLYYEILGYAMDCPPGHIRSLFVHVPCFHDNNGPYLIADFMEIFNFCRHSHRP
jgi:pyroglutamyl-peptidase